MRELKGRELQLYQLAILDCIDSFARQHQLTYYLSGGTLIGAVRHKGFIPWDDDIDIMLPRKDYDYLVEHFSDERYRLSSCIKDYQCDSPFARIWDSYTEIKWSSKRTKIGVYVDIFPIDGYPNSKYLSKLREHIIMFNRKRLMVSLTNPASFKGKLAFIKRTLCRYAGNPNKICRRMEMYSKRYDYEKAQYVGVQIGTHLTYRERNLKSSYGQTVYLEFEGRQMPAPNGYDAYLTGLYGDYMTLPPEEKRCSAHKTLYFLLESNQ